MHLARTGAFVRALSQARLVAPRPRPKSINIRYLSTSSPRLSSPAAFPEQSVSDSFEVDPRKTAPDPAVQVDQDENEFVDFLKERGPGSGILSSKDGKRNGVNILHRPFVLDSTANLSDSILKHIGRGLYDEPNHPIAITRRLIESVFPSPVFENHVAKHPVVSTHDNFDVLGFPADHPGRSRTDTYYVNSSTVLRTHTSAHQHIAFQLLKGREGKAGYTICADVYRRDSIDRSHFPVFHQMEGACVWKLPVLQGQTTRLQKQDQRTMAIKKDLETLSHDLQVLDECGDYNNQTNQIQVQHDPEEAQFVVKHLKRSLEMLVQKVFSAAQAARPDVKQEPLKVRWIEAYFPFTSPSFELEVYFNGEWLEILGCGVVQQAILNNAELKQQVGWAWGIGIERLAMILFNIPDIRLFWTEDSRFTNQFKEGRITSFQPYSKYPGCYKDVSFWINPSPAAASPLGAESSSGVAAAAGGDSTKASPAETQPAAFHENDIMEIVRDVAGDLVEDVKLTDEFAHPKTGKKSLCYRINYRSTERTLTNEEVDQMQESVVEKLKKLPVEIR